MRNHFTIGILAATLLPAAGAWSRNTTNTTVQIEEATLSEETQPVVLDIKGQDNIYSVPAPTDGALNEGPCSRC